MESEKSRHAGKPVKTGNYCVYMLQCRDGTLYTGYTNDLPNRIRKHASGRGAKYTRGKGPLTLVYVRKFRLLGNALRTEKAIQKLPRKEKMLLVRGYSEKNPNQA